MNPLNYVDISEQKAQLVQMKRNEKDRASKAIDYATSLGIRELNRNLVDSAALFLTQRNQADLDATKALDNQVLYAESRGDRGGIG